MPDQATIDRQIALLEREIRPQLTKEEAQTFEIRPSVSHGDIEVFLAGRLFWVDSAHFAKVEEYQRVDNPKGIANFAAQVLERLRGKKFISTTTTDIYDPRKVAREINYVLVNMYAKFLPPEEEKKLDEHLDHKLLEVFKLEKMPAEYDAGHYQLLNRLIVAWIVQYVRKVRK